MYITKTRKQLIFLIAGVERRVFTLKSHRNLTADAQQTIICQLQKIPQSKTAALRPGLILKIKRGFCCDIVLLLWHCVKFLMELIFLIAINSLTR